MRIVKKHVLISAVYHFIGYYPAPSNITYFWNFGILAGVCLVIQIISGIGLVMHYTPHIDLAFNSVEHIMRDVNYGWLMRYIHANGASMFFLIVYIHMFRGLYYGSYMYPRESLWCSGVIIFILMMATGFMGYVLPWGQMSFWGATVITNLFSAIPIIGQEVVFWLWGGFSVDNPTLNKLFSIHYVLPFVILAVMLIHLIFLHQYGSNNPLGIISRVDEISFIPYLTIKDVFSFMLFFIFFSVFVYFMPNVLGHSDNYIAANPLVTPTHIVPEWYLLPFYAILRSIPSKLGGVAIMAGSMLVLLLLPFFIKSEVRSSLFRPIYRVFFWLFFIDTLILGWLGGSPIKYPYYELGQFCTFFYFFYFLFILPVCSIFESILFRIGIFFNLEDDNELKIKK
jgi:ubiquinol-cytochrome c reductase cytochrome b subunit